MSKKVQMMNQLQLALKRKVQQKYHPDKGVNVESQPSQAPTSPDTHANNKPKQPVYRSKDYQARSPRPTRKDLLHAKSHKQLTNQVSPSKDALQNIVPEQDKQPSKIQLTSQEELNLWYQKQLEKKKVQNLYLSSELKTLQKGFQVLESETRILKKQKDQTQSLREQNQGLVKENQFLQAKIKRLQDIKPRKSSAKIEDNEEATKELQAILMQLNMSFIKHESEGEDNFLNHLKRVAVGVTKLSEDKDKIASKLKSFDIETVLMREANAGYKTEIEKLRNELRVYQDELQKMQLEVSSVSASKKMIEGIHKEVCRQLEVSRKEVSQIQEIYKHRKPKRQSAMMKSLKDTNTLENVSSLVKNFNDKEVQVGSLPETESSRLLEQSVLMKEQIRKLQCSYDQEQSQKIQLLLEIDKRSDDLLKIQMRVKELELELSMSKEEALRLSSDMRAKEEQVMTLQSQSGQKDQDLIAKFQTINKLRIKVEEVQQKSLAAEMEMSKQKFERQLQAKQIQRLTNQIKMLTDKSTNIEQEAISKQEEFKINLTSKTVEMSKVFEAMQDELKRQLRQKNQRLEELQSGQQQKVTNYQRQVHKLNQNNQAQRTVIEELRNKYQQLEKVHAELKVQKDKIVVKQTQTTEKFDEFTNNYKELELKQAKMEIERKENQKYTVGLEQKLKIAKQENQKSMKALEESQIRMEEARKDLSSIKVKVSTTEAQNRNNSQLKGFYSKKAEDLESKCQELERRLHKTALQRNKMIEQVQGRENEVSQLKCRLTIAEGSGENTGRQNEELREQLRNISEHNQALIQEIGDIKNETGRREHDQGEIISRQEYDIQRLIRENKGLKSKIEQKDIIAQSRSFKAGQLEERLVFLTEENRSLSSKYDMLLEELQIKDRNRLEGQAHIELKNQQYFMILDRMLSGWVRPEDMRGRSVEELLQMGCQRVEALRDRGEYELTGLSARPLYNFATEITSQQQLIAPYSDRKSDLEGQQQAEAISPARQVRYTASPKEQPRRTVRLVSQVVRQ